MSEINYWGKGKYIGDEFEDEFYFKLQLGEKLFDSTEL